MSLLSLTALELTNSLANNGQDGNAYGEEERLLPAITTSLKTADSSSPTSATHQQLLDGKKTLNNASTSKTKLNADSLNASGQLEENLSQVTTVSANLI